MQCQSYAQSDAMHDARPDQRLRGRAGRAPPAARRGGGRADGEGPQKRWLHEQFLFFLCYNRATSPTTLHALCRQDITHSQRGHKTGLRIQAKMWLMRLRRA